jgi:phosphoglycolate phosphatase
MANVKLVVMDLDDTLWTWTKPWQMATDELLTEVSKELVLDRDKLIAELKAVFSQYKTSEYLFGLYECPSIQQALDTKDPVTIEEKLLKHIGRYWETYADNFKVFDGALDFLALCKEHGIKVIGYTESQELYTKFRTSLAPDVVNYIHAMYCNKTRVDKEILKSGVLGTAPIVRFIDLILNPGGELRSNTFEYNTYNLEYRKPNPKLLETIVSKYACSVSDVIYIGDSLYRDVLMANKLNIDTLLMTNKDKSNDVTLLRALTHWSPAEVARDISIMEKEKVVPSYTAKDYNEVIRILEL